MTDSRDPDAQLAFGLRTIQQAYEEKARLLDHELQQLRSHTKQQAAQMSALERRVAELEQQVRESDERARQLADEKALVQQELKTTQRDLSKLDSFKRSILQSIHDDELPGSGAGVGGGFGPGGGPPVPLIGGAADYTPAALPPTPYVPSSPAPALGGHPLGVGASAGGAGGSFAPPTASASRGYGAGVASPAPPPTGGAASPGGGGGVDATPAAVVDGKDFFRQARLRLTYEQFNQFLSNIKRLNDHAQTRDETLARAQEIFGAENGDLFASFKTLLSKHGLT